MESNEIAGAGTDVEVIDVLRQYTAPFALRPVRDDMVRGVWLTVRDLLAPPRIPLPYERWIAAECTGRRQFFWLELLPQSVSAAKRRNPTRGRYASPRENRQSAGITNARRKFTNERIVTA